MLRAFLLSLAQLGDPSVIAVFLKSLVVTVVLLALLGAGLWFGAMRLFLALGGHGDAAPLVATVAWIAAVALAWLMFRAVAIGVMGVMSDAVVIAVERRHYPQALAQARGVPLARGIALGFGSAVRAVVLNVVLLPVYLVLLMTGVGTWLLFFLVNGWLLGRDLGQMVAARHLPDAMLGDWRKTGAVERLALGVAGTALFMVPILNLFAPILGAAMATHLYHAGQRT